MKKKLFALLLAGCLLMSGCSLASADGQGEVPAKDQLVGMFLTVSQQEGSALNDVWDAEAAGMEPLHLLTSQGQKLYAAQEAAEGVAPHTWTFPEGLGLLCTSYYVPSDGENLGFWSCDKDPEFSDTMSRIGSDNDVTRIELEATVYVADTVELHELTLYLNPVYQTPDGQVYALGTAPMGADASSMYGTSETISQETSTTLPDGIKTTGGSVTLSIEKVVLPEAYVILEMDENNQVLRTVEYAPEEMPETYTPGADAAYLILESRGADSVTRTVYSPDDESKTMDTFSPGRFGICIKGYTRIEWEG